MISLCMFYVYTFTLHLSIHPDNERIARANSEDRIFQNEMDEKIVGANGDDRIFRNEMDEKIANVMWIT